jgi:CBS domain-containing protein
MKVSEIMSTPVVTVTPDTTFKDALELLVERGISGLPVVTEGDHLVGIVTEADLIPKEAYQRSRRRALDVLVELVRGGPSLWSKSEATTVEHLMTRRPHIATDDEDVRAVARRMAEHAIKRLPVVDAFGRLVGIVSRRDVLSTFCRSDAEIAAEIRQRLASPRWAPEDATVRVGVDAGVVTLDGTIRHPTDRAVVEGAAWSVPGVVDVRAELTAQAPDPASR